jgi:hypothetical protein
MASYVTLVNKVLVRINEVPVDSAGNGFSTVRNVQALAKEAVNSSIRMILQTGQEWPFLKQTQTQVLVPGTRVYAFPSTVSSVDWETFYLKKSTAFATEPKSLGTLTYENYLQNVRERDDNGATGKPEYVYQTYGNSFGVTPIPDNADEIEYVSWTFPNDLVAYNDSCIIPDRFNHVIVDGAVMFMMRFRSNEQSAAVHQQNFNEGIKTMRQVLMDDEMYLRSTVIGGRS